jgi:hypothetical protein
MSCGLDVENRMRILGKVTATVSKVAQNLATVAAKSRMHCKIFFKPPPYHK